MHCPKCGYENRDNAIFCGRCGTDLQNTEQPQYNPYYIQQSKVTRKNNTGIIIGIVTGVAAVLLIICLFIMKPFAEKQGLGNADKIDTVVRTTALPTARPTKAVFTPSPSQYTKNNSTAASGSADYLFNSDTEYITNEFLDMLSQKQVRFILNEIYARHGYIFKLEEYNQFFSSKSWYVPRYTSDKEAEIYFNDIEKQNKMTIVNYEISKGWR